MLRAGSAALVLGVVLALPVVAQGVQSARLVQPNDRYDHDILGDVPDWGGLDMRLTDGQRLRVTLPETRVFEDVAARVADLDGDGLAEVLVVEADLALGAQLAVYDAQGKRAATGFYGQTHRWLAPAGSADLDGDGLPEIAYVDRPHLVRDLVIVRYRDGAVTEVARLPGLTNHRIGDSTISGGFRTCNGQTEVIVADADWRRVMAVSMAQGGMQARDTGEAATRAGFARAMACGG